MASKSWELGFGVCHKKVEIELRLLTRRLFGRLARASTANAIFNIFCPTHKRTEGRASVWGSEFTSKDAALQEGSKIAVRLNVKLCDLPDWW
jgi:hypothetical protein